MRPLYWLLCGIVGILNHLAADQERRNQDALKEVLARHPAAVAAWQEMDHQIQAVMRELGWKQIVYTFTLR